MKQSTLDLARRLVGLKHIEARFDAIEGRLGQIAYDISRLSQRLDEFEFAGGTAGAAREEPSLRLLSSDAWAVERDKIIHQINYTNQNLYLHLKEAAETRARYHQDVLAAIGTEQAQKPLQTSSHAVASTVPLDTLLIWIAIPKTASTSLADLIIPRLLERGPAFNAMARDNASALGTQHYWSVEELWHELSEEERSRVAFTGGHVPMGIDAIFGRKCSYFTFLRHPIDLIQSYYDFHCDVVPLYREAAEKGMTLESAIREYRMPGLFNLQTKILSGLQNLCPPRTGTQYSPEDCATPSSALDLAKHNLKTRFFMVGITEEYNKSLLILKSMMGWRLSQIIGPKKKVSSYQFHSKIQAGSSQLHDLIAENNQLDLELYEFAQELFKEAWSEHEAKVGKLLPLLETFSRIPSAFETEGAMLSSLSACRAAADQIESSIQGGNA